MHTDGGCSVGLQVVRGCCTLDIRVRVSTHTHTLGLNSCTLNPRGVWRRRWAGQCGSQIRHRGTAAVSAITRPCGPAGQVDPLTDLQVLWHHTRVGGQDGLEGQPSVDRQLPEGVAVLHGVAADTICRINCSGMQHDEGHDDNLEVRVLLQNVVFIACGFGCRGHGVPCACARACRAACLWHNTQRVSSLSECAAVTKEPNMLCGDPM